MKLVSMLLRASDTTEGEILNSDLTASVLTTVGFLYTFSNTYFIHASKRNKKSSAKIL